MRVASIVVWMVVLLAGRATAIAAQARDSVGIARDSDGVETVAMYRYGAR